MAYVHAFTVRTKACQPRLVSSKPHRKALYRKHALLLNFAKITLEAKRVIAF
jgi:hypothetical protein